jgi:hypothetical protein
MIVRSLRLAAAALVASTVLLVARPADVVRATCGIGEQCANISLELASGGGYGSGTVVSDPAGILCYEDQGVVFGYCSNLFTWSDGSQYLDVTLTFTPKPTSYACLPDAGLVEACYGLGEVRYLGVSVYNGENLNVSAKFKPQGAVTVRVTLSGSDSDGSGRVTSSPTGIDCRRSNGATTGTCEATLAAASTTVRVVITLTPSADSYVCVSGCSGIGQAKVLDQTLPSGTTWFFDALFKQGHPIVTAAITGSGTVTSSPAGISCPSDCSNYFPPSSSVTLTAKPKTGYIFRSWSGACSGTGDATCTLNLGSTDVATTAVFQQQLTATPKPTTSAAPTRAPAATAPPLPVGASSAPTTGASPEPGASAVAAAETAGAVPSGLAGAPGGVVTGPASSSPPGAAADPSDRGVDLEVPIAVGLALLVGLAIGFFFRSRGRRSPRPEGSH